MKRSLIATAAILALSSLVMTGCGASPTSGVPYKSTVKKSSTNTAVAQTPVAAAGIKTGALVLQLSSLKEATKAAYSLLATKADVAAVEIKLTGAGLSAPLTQRMTAEALKTTNTVAFEDVPSGAFQVSLTAFDIHNATIGAKSTAVQVQPDQETKVALQLKLNPTIKTGSGSLAFSFDIVDGDEVDAPANDTTPTPAPSATPSPDADEDDADDTQTLGIQVVGKETVRKFLILKKLSVTVKVTNHNATETLSGAVKIEFYNTTGIIKKETKLVETLTQSVKNLAPGKSVELTLVSTKAAEDAEATVDTVLSSASASTAE
ncbi:MAG: hypothetical protein ACK46X_01825 [Candidatus Sericytochromatia bacterium]